ncbi:MAG: hypothetical protein HY557_01675 [Euryarchaeota archaeon]|nr:hypothetical protein [Euryarchaeota archaeon]
MHVVTDETTLRLRKRAGHPGACPDCHDLRKNYCSRLFARWLLVIHRHTWRRHNDVQFPPSSQPTFGFVSMNPRQFSSRVD